MTAPDKRQKYKFVLTFILIILFCVTLYWSREKGKERDPLVYRDSLDLVAAEINGTSLTLRNLAFYVAYEETQVEEQAQIYDPKDPGKYWNVRTQNGFTRVSARKAVMQMALHDELFYQMAQGEIELSEEDEKSIKLAEQDFWEDLSERDGDARLGVTEEDIAEILHRMAYAQKYQEIYAAMQNKDTEDYDFNAEAFQKLLEEQKYTINTKVWERVSLGSVTLDH